MKHSESMHHQLTWSLFGNPLKALETAMLGKFGKASLITVGPSPNSSNICTIYHHITIYDPFWSYVIPCSKMHMIFNDQDESTVCLDGSKLFSPQLVLTGGGVATREPGVGVAQGETLRLGIWGSTKPGPGSMDEIHYTSTHHLVFLQNFGKSFSRLSWKSKQLLMKEQQEQQP